MVPSMPCWLLVAAFTCFLHVPGNMNLMPSVLDDREPFAVSFFPGWPKAASPPGGIYDDDGVFQTLSWSLIVRARWIARARFAR